MKAAVYTAYGSPDVVQVRDVEKPVPGADQVLIKVYAASLNPLDWRLMKGKPLSARLFLGLRKPRFRTPGRDVAGEVEAVGANVKQFKTGDHVFGSCAGAIAQYACTAESTLAIKPANVTFEQAASVAVAAYTALQGLRDKGRIQPGQQVLINGAAGGVGTFAVQIGKWLGADVTGVCSTKNADMVRSLGADHVIDYTRQDFTTGSRRYDLILDCIGNHSFSICRRVLNPKGIYVMVGGFHSDWIMGLMAPMIAGFVVSMFVSQKLVFFIARSSRQDLTTLGELISNGTVRPVIDRRFPLSEISEAICYLEQGHVRGKVIIDVAAIK
jgi:NADPH:quinone reductase-like Zn-dependent oxidoreductase